MKILIADDDAVSRRLTQRTLERAGYEVLAVEDGLSAVEFLSNPDGPRLALLDWVMPGHDGPTVCRMTRTRYDQPYIYIILLTSKESKEDMVAGFEAGADDYLTKPCDPVELKARLRAGERILQLQDKLVHDARHDPLEPRRFQDRNGLGGIVGVGVAILSRQVAVVPARERRQHDGRLV